MLERMEDDSVWYGVSTFSRPAHVLSFVGYPAVRVLQWKFARDSMRAMRVRLERALLTTRRRAAADEPPRCRTVQALVASIYITSLAR